MWPEESFFISDAESVGVELVSGYLSVTRPDEVSAYIAAWERLLALAVHGEQAAAQIRLDEPLVKQQPERGRLRSVRGGRLYDAMRPCAVS